MRTWNRWTLPTIDRASELRSAGLSYTAIATVLNLDYGTSFTTDSVRGAIRRFSPELDRGFSRSVNFRGAA